MRDLHSNIDNIGVLTAAVRTADADTGEVDLQGYESCEVFVIMGAEGITLDGTNYIQVKLEDGDVSGTLAAVDTADVIGVTPSSGVCFTYDAAAEAPAVSRCGYVGGKRYLKVTVDHVGTHGTGTPYAVLVIGGHPRQAPQS